MDARLHVLLGLLAFMVCLCLLTLLPATLAACAISSIFLFGREVTQEQTKLYQSDFLSGWNFLRWSAGKNYETWVPIAAIWVIGLLVW